MYRIDYLNARWLKKFCDATKENKRVDPNFRTSVTVSLNNGDVLEFDDTPFEGDLIMITVKSNTVIGAYTYSKESKMEVMEGRSMIDLSDYSLSSISINPNNICWIKIEKTYID